MLSASNLGQKTATFALIKSALNTSSLQDYQNPLYRLGLLAKNEDPQAMAILGKVLLTQSKENEALEWFCKATSLPTGNLDFEDAGEALVNMGRILLKQGDRGGAKAAFSKAALELDDPSAYFYLSQLLPQNSSSQEEYLLKSATSGITEACHNLGALELSKAEKQRDSTKTSEQKLDYKMAIEWFTIAAHDGFGLSMLNLAMIYKLLGDEKVGRGWLEAAKDIPEVFEDAQALEKSW
jgi:TPR repeat protein